MVEWKVVFLVIERDPKFNGSKESALISKIRSAQNSILNRTNLINKPGLSQEQVGLIMKKKTTIPILSKNGEQIVNWNLVNAIYGIWASESCGFSFLEYTL